jgi:hypothetical protein
MSVPLGLVDHVDRDGYTLTLTLRGLPTLVLRQLGKRTDEFLANLDRARADLAERTAAERTAAASAACDPSLAGLRAPDGWAVTIEDAGPHWVPLRSAVAGQSRASEAAVLEEIAGDRLRLGIKAVAGAARRSRSPWRRPATGSQSRVPTPTPGSPTSSLPGPARPTSTGSTSS